MKEVSFVNKKIVLPLALLLVALALTISPVAGAHASDGHAGHRAESGARRRPAKRRQNARKQNAQKQQAMYTCPMHHEVRSKTPGECPKCKMELELEETPAKAQSE
jgi:Heavy metal binding domain